MYGSVSGALADAVRADPLTRQYYGRPPLRDTILLPDQAQLPGRKYLDWHGPTSSLPDQVPEPELFRDAAWNISAPSTVAASRIRRSTPVIHSSFRQP